MEYVKNGANIISYNDKWILEEILKHGNTNLKDY